MGKKFYIVILGSTTLGTIYCFYGPMNESPSDKYKEALKIAPLNHAILPIGNVENSNEKSAKVSEDVGGPTFEDKVQGLDSRLIDPYQELRLRGAENLTSNTSIYLDSTILLEKNLDRDQVGSRVDRGEAKNPYSELKEKDLQIPEANTLNYLESTTALNPVS